MNQASGLRRLFRVGGPQRFLQIVGIESSELRFQKLGFPQKIQELPLSDKNICPLLRKIPGLPLSGLHVEQNVILIRTWQSCGIVCQNSDTIKRVILPRDFTAKLVKDITRQRIATESGVIPGNQSQQALAVRL